MAEDAERSSTLLGRTEQLRLEELGAKKAQEQSRLSKELLENAPPWEEIAPEELKRLEETGEIMAARAESYYYGYIRTSASGVEPQAAGAIVGAVVGSTVGTVVGQIVGKKLDKPVNIRDLAVRERMGGGDRGA